MTDQAVEPLQQTKPRSNVGLMMALFLEVAVFIAAYVPARRAARLDVLTAIAAE